MSIQKHAQTLTHTYANMHTHPHRFESYTQLCTYPHFYAKMNAKTYSLRHMHAQLHKHTHMHTHTYTCIPTYTSSYKHIASCQLKYLQAYTCIHMHKYEHMCIHTYTQMYALKFTQKFMRIVTYTQSYTSFICRHTYSLMHLHF